MAVKTYSSVPVSGEHKRFIACPLCGYQKFKPKWSSVQASDFLSCKKCTLVIQNPQPEQLAPRYDESYFRYEIENEEVFFKLMMQGLEDVNFFKYLKLTLPPNKRILDIGCATGRLLKHFKDLDWETTGCELCKNSAEYGNWKYGVNIIPKQLQELRLSDNYYSLVHASHLIEHVSDPDVFLKDVFRVLLPGGVFICVTPAIDGFQARLFGSSWRSVIADHMTLFSRKTLRQLLNKHGFNVEQIRSWGGLAKGTVPKWFKEIFDRLAKKYNFGDVILMVARKKREI